MQGKGWSFVPSLPLQEPDINARLMSKRLYRITDLPHRRETESGLVKVSLLVQRRKEGVRAALTNSWKWTAADGYHFG